MTTSSAACGIGGGSAPGEALARRRRNVLGANAARGLSATSAMALLSCARITRRRGGDHAPDCRQGNRGQLQGALQLSAVMRPHIFPFVKSAEIVSVMVWAR